MSLATTLRQAFKFGLVGILATLVHISIFVFCIEALDIRPFLANFPAYGVAVLVGFWGHFSWTFKRDDANDQRFWAQALTKFVIVSLLGLGLNSMIVYGVVDLMGWSYHIAILLMVTVTPAIVFVLSKLWAFAE
ncbi:GtrA family protein [Pseudomonadota bacterium]